MNIFKNRNCSKNAILKSMLLMVIALMLVFPASAISSGSKPKVLTPVNLRLKWIMVSGFAGEMAAKDLGYFQDEGLDVTLLSGGFENKPEKIVASGADTFGITGVDGILLARANGMPLVAFAAQYARNATAFFSLKGSGITRPEDFAGKKVGVKYGLEMDPIYRALMKKYNVDQSGIKEIPMSYSIAPLLEKQVDVFPSYMNSIFPAVTNQGVEVNVIDPFDYGVRFHGNLYFCTEETLKEKPEVVAAFTKAVIKGWEWANANPEKVGDLVFKFNEKIKPKSEVEAFKVVQPYLKPSNGQIGWMDKTIINETRTMLLESGMLKKQISIEDGFTWKFLKQVYK